MGINIMNCSRDVVTNGAHASAELTYTTLQSSSQELKSQAVRQSDLVTSTHNSSESTQGNLNQFGKEVVGADTPVRYSEQVCTLYTCL